MTPFKVGYLIGSLAKASINRKLAQALVNFAPDELDMTEISFGDLPLYSYDYDHDFPRSARTFKEALSLPRLSSSLPPNTTALFPVASRMPSTGLAALMGRIRSHGNPPQLSGPPQVRSGRPSLSRASAVC